MEKLIGTGVTGQTWPSGMGASLIVRDHLLISHSLPLLNDNGAGLAIAVSTYLDDVDRHGKKKNEKTPSESTKEAVKSNFGWLPQVPSISRNLKDAFNLWDAVSVDLCPMLCCDADKNLGLLGIQGGW
jgi:Temperature dependent protein affecting M2 dsRNA replication